MNLDGPVRVADIAGSASVTLSFDNWKGAKVAPTTHTLTVLPAKRAAKAEPVSEGLVGTLVHPDRKASIWTVKFSPDGAKLFATGYPSGVVQIFDVAARKELRRIDTPPGYRGSPDYALMTPDWKTLYVPVGSKKVVTAERDGKPVTRVEYGGSVRVWDLAIGEEKAPLRPADGHSPEYAVLSPDGKSLVCIERPGFDATDDGPRPKDVTVIWDLATGTRRKLGDGFLVPNFTPGGKTLLVQGTDHDAKTSAVRVLDAATLKELARFDRPDKDRNLSLDGVSPDGAVAAVSLSGKKGAPREVWFRDARTLADRGKFVGDGDPNGYGWSGSGFSPDGRLCAILDAVGKVTLWDVAAGKVARQFDLGGGGNFNLAFSPDGKLLAVPWMPKFEGAGERNRDPDPQDYPQPRVTVFDVSGKFPPRTFVSRHGFVGPVAFSPDGKTLAFGSSGGVHLFDLSK